MTLQLRDYQEANIAEIRGYLAAAINSVLWQLPTGGGKTAGAAYMAGTAAKRGRRVWFIVHRRELLKQSSTAFHAAGIPHAMIAAGMPYDRRHAVHICAIDTLRRRLDKVDPPDLIIWDECHHLAAESWAAVFARYPAARHIGLSATPERLDGNGLGKFFKAMVIGPSTASLIASGNLSPYRLFAPAVGVDLSGVHTVAGDYNKKELNDAMDKPHLVGNAVTHYLKIANGRPSLLFAPSVKFSDDIAARFRDAGIPALHIDATTESSVRDGAIADLEAGRLKVLCNVDLFGEGVSVNNVACVIQTCPTQSLAKHLQQIGRGLRLYPGKHDCLILDHAGNSARHGLPDDEREWSLEGRDKKKGAKRDPDDIAIRQCKACFAISKATALVCRECGKPFELKPRKVEEREGELAEVDPDALRAQQKRAQAGAKTVEALVSAVGYSIGRAQHIVQAREEKARLQDEVFSLASQAAELGIGDSLSIHFIRALKPKVLRELRDELYGLVNPAPAEEEAA